MHSYHYKNNEKKELDKILSNKLNIENDKGIIVNKDSKNKNYKNNINKNKINKEILNLKNQIL